MLSLNKSRASREAGPHYRLRTDDARDLEIREAELRRYSRVPASSPVVLEAGNRWVKLQLVNLSPSGAKVRLTEPVEEGTTARLYFLPPHWRPLVVDAMVWRIDLDGVVFFFTGPRIAPDASRADS